MDGWRRDGWRRRWWFTVTGLIKSSGRTGGTGSRALGVLLCPAEFYCSLMGCCVRACVHGKSEWAAEKPMKFGLSGCVSTEMYPVTHVYKYTLRLELQFPGSGSECDYYWGINVSRLQGCSCTPHPPPLLCPQLWNWDHVLLLCVSSTRSPHSPLFPILTDQRNFWTFLQVRYETVCISILCSYNTLMVAL